MVDLLQSLIDEYVDQLPEASRRSAYGFPCYFARGHVFGLYDGYALVLKFDEPTAEGLLATEVGKGFRHAVNTKHKLWVRINPGRVQSERALEALIRQSYDYVLRGLA